jgi:hypothetical protein
VLLDVALLHEAAPVGVWVGRVVGHVAIDGSCLLPLCGGGFLDDGAPGGLQLSTIGVKFVVLGLPLPVALGLG